MGAYTEIVDFTFTANETSRTFSGLSITKDDFVKVVVTAVNPLGSSVNYHLFPNGNTTLSNYHTQTLAGFGSTVSASRANNNILGANIANVTNLMFAYIKLSENDRFNYFANEYLALTSSVEAIFRYVTSSGATFTSGITSLTLQAGTTNGIGTGSRIQIYKLAATKVADITVTSNTTQVDISNLSIDKDSEYLLVSDVTIVSGGNRYQLFVNDNTTQTNYFNQALQGDNTVANTGRENNATLGFNDVVADINYTFIKLSNIGAYTSQTYQLRGRAGNLPSINNIFASSTAENITSITKLNIVAAIANTIQAGSRFILYKLYE